MLKMQEFERKAAESGKTPEEKSKKASIHKGSSSEEWKPSNIAEYLFSNERGVIADDINTQEIDSIYNGYMQTLINSYDRLKGKFNTFAAKCLSERQKRESGLLLVAPPLSLPGTDHEDGELNTFGSRQEEIKQKENLSIA